jgi:hypothetical protein
MEEGQRRWGVLQGYRGLRWKRDLEGEKWRMKAIGGFEVAYEGLRAGRWRGRRPSWRRRCT